MNTYASYSKVYERKMSDAKDDIKIKLLLRKFGSEEHRKYSHHLGLKEHRDHSFEENLDNV